MPKRGTRSKVYKSLKPADGPSISAKKQRRIQALKHRNSMAPGTHSNQADHEADLAKAAATQAKTAEIAAERAEAGLPDNRPPEPTDTVTQHGVAYAHGVKVDAFGFTHMEESYPQGTKRISGAMRVYRRPGERPDWLPPVDPREDRVLTTDDLPPWSDRYSVEPNGTISQYWRKTTKPRGPYTEFDPFSN